jgi:transposase
MIVRGGLALTLLRFVLLAGSDGGGRSWAWAASVIETCKLNGVEPYTYLYLQDILARLVAGHPVNRLDELLPWNWKAAR